MAKVVLDIIANTGPLTQVNNELNKVATASKKVGDTQKQAFKSGADSAAAANKGIKELTGNLTIAGVNVGALSSKFGQTTSSLGSVTKGFGLLKVAIASTGIGAIVIALTSLIAYFTKTEKGAELLERATAGLGAAFDVVMGVLAKFGEVIVSVFTNPKKALSDLVNFVEQNLINRFKSFAVILDGITSLDFKKVSNGFIQLGTGIENGIDKARKFGDELSATAKKAIDAAKAAAELTRQLQDLEDTERANAIAISKNQTEIDKLLVKSKNRSLAEKDRIALLERASKLEESNLKTELEGADKRVSIIAQENKLKKDAGTLRDEDEDKLKDAIIARDNLERSSLVLQEKIINRKDALVQEFADKQQKAIDDSAKAEQDRIAKVKAAFDQESALNDTNFKRKEVSLRTSLANGIISEASYNRQVIEAKSAALQDQIDTIEKFNNEGLDLSLLAAQTEVDLANNVSDAKIKAIQALAEITKKANEEAIADAQKMQAAEDDRIKKEGERQLERVAIFQDATTQIGTLIGEALTDQEFSLEEFSKKFILLALDTLEKVALLSVAEGTIKSVATFGPIAGLVRSAIIAALIKGAFAVAKGAVSKGFAEGGYTGDGDKHSEAGVVHKGEFVHTKESTKKHRNLFEAIHSGDYSALKLIDLKPLLQGTGVSLNNDVAESINASHSQYAESKSKREYALESEIKAMKKDMNKFFAFYKTKPDEKTLSDGTKIIRRGNNTRIIKPKK